MSSVEAIKEIENYLDYEGSVSIQAIATLYTSYNKEKEKNKELENKIKAVLELIDTKPYTAYTLYGDILYDDENIREILEERRNLNA